MTAHCKQALAIAEASPEYGTIEKSPAGYYVGDLVTTSFKPGYFKIIGMNKQAASERTLIHLDKIAQDTMEIVQSGREYYGVPEDTLKLVTYSWIERYTDAYVKGFYQHLEGIRHLRDKLPSVL